MPVLTVVLDGDGALSHIPLDRIIHLGNNAPPIKVMALPGGMESGLPSVAFGIALPDGRYVLAETSLRLFLCAARVLAARYDDLEDL